MMNADDIEAINRYIHATKPRTPAANKALDEWVKWFEATKPGLIGYWSDADVDHATNLRNAFNRANAVTAEDKAVTEKTIREGLSLEQMRGETDRRDSGGNIKEAPPSEPVPRWEWALFALAGIAVVAIVIKKV